MKYLSKIKDISVNFFLSFNAAFLKNNCANTVIKELNKIAKQYLLIRLFFFYRYYKNTNYDKGRSNNII